MRSGEKYHEFVLRQADVLAGRAIYLTGFCQSGVTRFKVTDHPAGYGYLVFIVLAFISAALPAFLLSVMSIFITDTQPHKREAIAVLFRNFWRALFLCYINAFLALSIALTLMGWGCQYPHEGWIPLHAGLGAVGCLLAALAYIWGKHQDVKRTVSDDDTTAAPGVLAKASESVETILALINNTGSQATISSGFVFYNVVTFGTDILTLSFTSKTMKEVFLEVNALTVAAGLVASVFDSLITLFANDLRGIQQRARFLHSTRLMVRVCTNAYLLSLLGFITGFALFGLVKFEDTSYVELWFSVFAGACIVMGGVLLNYWRRQATSIAHSNSVGRGGAEAEVDDATLHKLENRPKRFNMTAYRALFFGGFAYFAINFFVVQDRAVSDAYPVFMSATFTLSITVVLWSAIYNINNSYCVGRAAKVIFTHLTRLFYLVSVVFSIAAMVSFLLGFAMIGYIKKIAHYDDYAPVMLIGTVFVALFVPVVVYMVYRSFSIARNPHLYVKEDLTFSYASMMGQIDVAASQTSFIAGNVFYEILFSVADAPTRLPNYVYFISATTTFATGACVIAISTCISFWMARLRTEDHRRRFGRMVKGLKTLLFVLNDISIVAWMTSLTVLGRVKYDAKHGHLYEPSLVLGLFGITVLAASFARIKSISNWILHGSHGGDSSAASMAQLLIPPDEGRMDASYHALEDEAAPPSGGSAASFTEDGGDVEF
jgi:hypothetical protein